MNSWPAPHSRSAVFAASVLAWFACATPLLSQDSAAGTAKPAIHILGTISKVDAAEHSVVVKEDKTGTEQIIQLGSTKTLLKVEPGATDLKNATRISADDLQTGDRVDVRATKDEQTNALAARSVVLMSGRALQQAHQTQAAEWQHSTPGTVSSVDAAGGKLNVQVRGLGGPKPVSIETTSKTEFTRYAPENPKTPAASELSQIRPGDQVRVIGDRSDDGSTIQARRVYSGAFRTLSATISSISADGKSISVKDLATKKMVDIVVSEEASLHRLPPMMAAMLARRLNPSANPPGANSAGANSEGQAGPPAGDPGATARPAGQQGMPGQRGPGGRGNGDLSQMIESTTKIAVADLKQGDAVVISGAALGVDNTRLLATTIIAGVEPILQSSPQRQGGQNLAGDWGLGEMAVPQ